MQVLLIKTMSEFRGCFINDNKELILIPKTNLYISLRDVDTSLDLKCKLLEWCSRDCVKAQPYNQEWRNQKYRLEVLSKLNEVLRTNFTQDEMELIYQKLGNAIRHNLTIKFVNSGYDLSVLKGE